MADAKALGKALKRAREDAGLEQREVAARLGVHYITVSRWENAKQAIKDEDVRRLAALYAERDVDTRPVLALLDLEEGYVSHETPRRASRETSAVEEWHPNPSLRAVIAPRAYAAALAYLERLQRAGLPVEQLEEAERLLIDERYARQNARSRQPMSEEDQITMVDRSWDIIAEVLSWQGIKP